MDKYTYILCLPYINYYMKVNDFFNLKLTFINFILYLLKYYFFYIRLS